MSNYAAVKVGESMEVGSKYTVTKEMILDSPSFETQEEANNYCDIINPDFLWAIVPLKDLKNEQ